MTDLSPALLVVPVDLASSLIAGDSGSWLHIGENISTIGGYDAPIFDAGRKMSETDR